MHARSSNDRRQPLQRSRRLPQTPLLVVAIRTRCCRAVSATRPPQSTIRPPRTTLTQLRRADTYSTRHPRDTRSCREHQIIATWKKLAHVEMSLCCVAVPDSPRLTFAYEGWRISSGKKQPAADEDGA